VTYLGFRDMHRELRDAFSSVSYLSILHGGIGSRYSQGQVHAGSDEVRSRRSGFEVDDESEFGKAETGNDNRH
jgi:hypothetical protein